MPLCQLLNRDAFDRGWGCQFVRTIAALAAQADRSQDSTHFWLGNDNWSFFGSKISWIFVLAQSSKVKN